MVKDQVVFETWLRKNILEANILSLALLPATHHLLTSHPKLRLTQPNHTQIRVMV
jgi:hypothetical protein